MFAELKDALLKEGSASITITDDTPIRIARGRLIEAAKRANVRVQLRRQNDSVTATVLSPEEGDAQRERDIIFRAVNHIKRGIETLDAGTIDTEGMQEEIDDLKDIVHTLEEDARAKLRGATS